jgi:putative spermidine/putrescine transport system permease protein
MERAARSLGANAWRTLRYVTLPSIRESIIAGAIFSFLVSFDEVVIAIFVGGPSATTLPKQMWESIRFEIDPTLTAIASMLTLLAIAVLAGAELVSGRRGAGAKQPPGA